MAEVESKLLTSQQDKKLMKMNLDNVEEDLDQAKANYTKIFGQLNQATANNNNNLAEIENLHEVIKELESEMVNYKEENAYLNTDVGELSTKIELLVNELNERKGIDDKNQSRIEDMHQKNK